MLKLEEAQERLHHYKTDTPLFATEIHMIKCVKENPNRHMTALAEVLGVTRGAVSQIAMKLEGKVPHASPMTTELATLRAWGINVWARTTVMGMVE